MTESNSLPVREFVYMDVPKLYSLYSQTFKGVRDSFEEEKINQLVTAETQGIPFGSAKETSEGLQSVRHREYGVLHDHMYNLLENKLASIIKNAADVPQENLSATLMQSPIVKVAGPAEIEDFERLAEFTEKFNELAEAIAYAQSSHDPKLVENAALAATASHQTRKKLDAERAELIRKLTYVAGLAHDEQNLSNLRLFIKMFNPTGYFVSISPANNKTIHYRGVVNKSWLRMESELLRKLYGAQSNFPWTMVGTVTHIQGTLAKPSNPKERIASIQPTRTEEEQKQNPMMLDAYRGMFRAALAFERMFLESDSGFEVVLAPLAIYREFHVAPDVVTT